MLNKEDKKAILDIRQNYRNCFDSKAGKWVLMHMLYEMRFFNDDIDENDHDGRVLRNYANTILERLGCADNPYLTLEYIVSAILRLPIEANKDEE